MVRVWRLVAITAVSVSAHASDAIPLLQDCSSPDVVAAIQKSDPVRVRYALGGNTQTCYAVSATVNGKSVDGYLLGAAHPDVAAFEGEARSRVPAIPPPPPPPATTAKPASTPTGEIKEKPAAPEAPKTFSGLSGTSPDGHRVSLNGLRERTLVLYFWSASDKKSIREVNGMESLYLLYGSKGVGLVGVVSGASAAQVRKVLSEEEVNWPQIVDHGDIAARYPETRETRFFILDRNRDVVAALTSADQVHRELAKLRKQTGGAE